MEEFLGRDVGGRSALLVRGLVTLMIGALVMAVTTAYSRGVFRDTVTARAMIDNAGGSLVPGADVKSRGVMVGKAESITLAGGGVEIRVVLDRASAANIPADVKARVLPATVFGTSYVDLIAPVNSSAEALKSGQVIGQDRSAGTLELQTTLDNIDRVVRAVHPAELATTLGAISQALKGRGNDLGASMQTLETYLARLNPHLPLLQQDLHLLAVNLENLDRHAPDVLAAVEDGLVTARTITAKRAEITTILSGGGALVAEADRFLTAEEQPIVDTVRQSAVVVDALYDERGGIASGLRSFVRFANRGSPAFSDGPWLNTDTHIVTSGGAQYTSADCPRYGNAHGDNCPGGATAGSSIASDPRLDSAIVQQLKDALAQFDDIPPGGIAELLSRPLLGDIGGGR